MTEESHQYEGKDLEANLNKNKFAFLRNLNKTKHHDFNQVVSQVNRLKYETNHKD